MSSVPMSESQRISTGLPKLWTNSTKSLRSLESPSPGTNFSAPRRDRQPVAHSNFGAYQTHPMLSSKGNYPMHHQDICVRCKMKHSCRSPLEKYYFFIADKKTVEWVFYTCSTEDSAFGGLHPRGVAEVYLFELKDTVNVEQSLRNLQDSVTTVKAHKVHKVVDDTYRLW